MFVIKHLKIHNIVPSVCKRKYNIHYDFHKHHKLMSKNISHQIAIDQSLLFDDPNIGDVLMFHITNSINHKKAYKLLKKIDNGDNINKTEYDNIIIDLIESCKILDNNKEIYVKFNRFKESIECE